MKNNTINNLDCIEFLKNTPSEYFDLSIADPPYYGIVKEDWDNQWKNEREYLEWCENWISEIARTLKTNGSFYVWGCFGENNIVFAKLAIICEKYFTIKNWINWQHEYGFRGKTNYSYKKEELLFCVKNPKQYTFNYMDIKEPATRAGATEKDTRTPSNIWNFKWNNMSKERIKGFPSQKPIESSNRMIKASSNVGDIVYIPFAGSGTDIESCIINKRVYIATEKKQEYIDNVIIPRLSIYE